MLQPPRNHRNTDLAEHVRVAGLLLALTALVILIVARLRSSVPIDAVDSTSRSGSSYGAKEYTGRSNEMRPLRQLYVAFGPASGLASSGVGHNGADD